MSAKKIIAMFAVVGAQDAANPDGRTFSNSLDGFGPLDTFTNYYYSEPAGDIYEDLENLYDINNSVDDYDGTTASDDSAGRPSGGDDEDGKALNMGSIASDAAAGKTAGFNECRSCNGLTATECAAASFDTCNDAQDACQVEVRSQFIGNAVQHKFYSGCASKFACQAQMDRNFYSTSNSDKMRNRCRGTELQNRRNYQPSMCMICTKLGDSTNSNTVLFGNNDSTYTVDAAATNVDNWADILADPTVNIIDFYGGNDWY